MEQLEEMPTQPVVPLQTEHATNFARYFNVFKKFACPDFFVTNCTN
jgi:hypothetical protein